MDVMTMPEPLLPQIERDFPAFVFAPGEVFAWLPEKQTITHPAVTTDDDIAQLLHELSHGILQHTTYDRDIQLIDMEREAWKYAVETLAPRYAFSLAMDHDVVQDALDSYRDWLHERSTCPKCNAVGLEAAKHRYRCLHCQGEWRVNEAKQCQLRRYRVV